VTHDIRSDPSSCVALLCTARQSAHYCHHTPCDIPRECSPRWNCNPNLTDFSLLRRQTQQNPELLNTLNAISLHGSRFNASHPTKIIIHGFAGGRHLSPSTDLRDGMLAMRDSHRSSLTMSKVVLSVWGYKLKIQFFWDVRTCQL